MARGRRLEAAICEWAADDVGLVAAECSTLQSREHPIVIASPDRLLYRDRTMEEMVEVLEAKSPRRTMHAWTRPEESPTGIDPEYLPQVTWEMAAAGLDRATVAALCYGELWVYRLTLDQELLGLLIQQAERFWRDHIQADRPPDPTCEADQDVLRRIYPAERAPLAVRLDLAPLVVEWRIAEAQAKAAVEKAGLAKARVMAGIGESEGIDIGSYGRVAWKANRPSRKTDWEKVAESAGASEEDIARHTTERQGARVLRDYPAKEG
jgi:hypothetical protein